MTRYCKPVFIALSAAIMIVPIRATYCARGAAYVAERFKDAGGGLIEKVRTSICPEQARKQSDSRRSRNIILIYSAIAIAFAAGFLAASVFQYTGALTVRT